MEARRSDLAAKAAIIATLGAASPLLMRIVANDAVDDARPSRVAGQLAGVGCSF
jgi:hypothetical protein